MKGWTVQLLGLLLGLVGLLSAESGLHVGGAINIFTRYGYMSISMKVVPRNETDSNWIYREPTVDVFRNVAAYELPTPTPDVAPLRILNGDFHMEFCENLRQLLQAYFRDFNFESLDRPWRAFTGSWSKSAMAKHLGINSSYITGDHCYVLVRVSRHREVRSMHPADSEVPYILDEVMKGGETITIGDEGSVYKFVKDHGSHYVLSYTTGNALYQVFVYEPAVYFRIKERLTNKGIDKMPQSELTSYFSPWYAEHVGEIQSASGNLTTQSWAEKVLRSHFYFFTFPSLLRLHGDSKRLKALNDLLGNEALLGMEMRTLAPIVRDDGKRAWFSEVLDNYLKLMETNM